MKISSKPVEVKLKVLVPGSKSTVPKNCPVVYTLPAASMATDCELSSVVPVPTIAFAQAKFCAVAEKVTTVSITKNNFSFSCILFKCLPFLIYKLFSFSPIFLQFFHFLFQFELNKFHLKKKKYQLPFSSLLSSY